ncbi:hypothetical protein G7043_00485 [Lentzea sp. NEAU-D13]|uniref:Uncharacterized protein n=1 Tax=Lentzea alba TaxID=2714351 RepID=A0A7C9VTV2_9PSEU|nr:hypothetical protein [Lentzea alba]NGY57399.1 hypothetical protein [Lentzea alba]
MKELLERSMPEFEPVPDRLDRVRAKMRARRDRRLVTGAAAAVLVVAAGAAVAVSRPAPPEPAPAAAATDACQQRDGRPYIRLDRSRGDVPVGASKVTLCVYLYLGTSRPSTDQGPDGRDPELVNNWQLVGARQQAGDGSIERKVNAMPAPGLCYTSGGEYQWVFEYPDQPPFVKAMTSKCNVPIQRDELLRDGDLLGWLDRMERSTAPYMGTQDGVYGYK